MQLVDQRNYSDTKIRLVHFYILSWIYKSDIDRTFVRLLDPKEIPKEVRKVHSAPWDFKPAAAGQRPGMPSLACGLEIMRLEYDVARRGALQLPALPLQVLGCSFPTAGQRAGENGEVVQVRDGAIDGAQR